MGLDTDDIVALSMDIPLIVIAVLMIVAMFFMKSPYVVKELRRLLIKAQTNSELRHYSILRIIMGDKDYSDLLLKCENNADENYNKQKRYNDGKTWQEEFGLTPDIYELQMTNRDKITYEEWYRSKPAYAEFIRTYNTYYIPPSKLYFAISRKIESKEL